MNKFEQIKKIAEKYKLNQVLDIIYSAKELQNSNFIDIAILGQFKAGKTSLINTVIGENILPTGVIPVTAIITRIFYSPETQVVINFSDGKQKNITPEQLKEYITETDNPKNIKKVTFADVGTPQMQNLKGIRLIDTPGLGSIFSNNTQTTEQHTAKTTVALVVISAERPLSEQDKKLLDEIKKFSYKTFCIITKVDLFSDEQIQEIKNFVAQGLQKELNAEIPVILFSSKKDTEKYKQNLFDKILKKFTENTFSEIDKIYGYKLSNAVILTQNYLKIAHKSSLKTLQEQAELHNKIFNSQTSANFLHQQVQLIASDLKSKTRPELEKLFLKYKKQITANVQDNFLKNYPTWKGNLNRISRQYENWMKKTLESQMLQVITPHLNDLNKIIDEAKTNLQLFTETFTENIRKKILKNLGIDIEIIDWQTKITTVKTPDISIYRAFDSNIDILWFLFPMFIFKNIFRRHFYKQIPAEVEKNIYRIISNLTGTVNTEIERLAIQAIKYINQYIETIATALNIQQSQTDELTKDIRIIENL